MTSALPTPGGARTIDDPEELLDFFADDRAVHLYSLVDLEEPFWSASRWFRRGDAVVGVVATPTDGIITATGVSTRDPAGSLALLADVVVDLPAGLMLTGPTGLAAALEPVRRLAWSGSHVKYELRDRRSIAEIRTPDSVRAAIESLGVGDVDRLLELYATEPDAAFFLPSMLADDSFVGLAAGDGRLVAAAGTHVLSDRQRLAAIGSVFVRPDHRGRALGRAVTRAVVERLLDRCDVIGLNVEVSNTPARAIYDELGFAPVLDYDEVVLG